MQKSRNPYRTLSNHLPDNKGINCTEACLKCAVFFNHCPSSCTQEEDVKMMAKCIQLDMECSAICYASAQLMSLGSDKEKEICRLCADICEAVATSVENTPHSIVKNVAKHVRNVLRKVGTYNYLMVWQDVCKPFFGRDLKGAIFSKLKKPSDEN